MTMSKFLIFLVCVMTACAGCRSRLKSPLGSASVETSLGPADNDDHIRTVSGSSSHPMTFTDSESLRYGTGPIGPNGPGEFQVTTSGLRYRVLRAGNGRKPQATDSVTVQYRGWLDDGTEFDSSYDRPAPASFRLNQKVIAGWTEGMQLADEGGMIELWIPARLGYGREGSGRVPPNATLHFVVELLKVG